MTRREWIGAALCTAYFVATSLGHLEVSLWLVERRSSAWLGDYRLVDFLAPVGGIFLVAFVAWQARQALIGTARGTTIAAWTAWLAAVLVIDRTLIYSLPEYLHYPQYALLAWLIAAFIDPGRTEWPVGRILLAVTLLGIADEALQYAWITTSYSNYLDFNDFLLNLLGGAAGLLAYYGFVRRPDRPSTRLQAARGAAGFAWLGSALLLTVLIATVLTPEGQPLYALEREFSYGLWISGPHAGEYFVLPPVPGTLLLTLSGIAIALSPCIRRSERAAATQ
jgi:hypothetical protein